ncbi:putative transcriptional regulator [Sphaerochaeta pleomorpha str. Grapes]|uniref:Putative transcriptional regulator n=1 Tax=Sphaerochaeta pleomorpha (strain ATCC BAA-1885 / DSM 22778 / Grapes) TaxID=158190 RepID=G8QSD6_SPHPG|nr:DUF4180 domain-containing protein [Sphaerochaeta pleomorpha]AEV30066.1 putative transcriptional regulator [Sphaerochaeta pleomorpha str. Grapes]
MVPIGNAILGVLSWKPCTGYELKKLFETSSFMYWSGNNNQIYKTLLLLKKEGLVENEVIHQESSPLKKRYFITGAGTDALRKWLKSSPQAPEYRKSFLVQVAWSDSLSDQELDLMLSAYEEELTLHSVMEQEKMKRGLNNPRRNSREEYIWEAIAQNILDSYKKDLDWVREVRQQLREIPPAVEESLIHYVFGEADAKPYLEVFSASPPMGTTEDIIRLLGLCSERKTHLLLLHESALAETFFHLSSKVAGNMLQKLANYTMKTALIVSSSDRYQGKFWEMALEANRSGQFRIFEQKEDAITWLTSPR